MKKNKKKKTCNSKKGATSKEYNVKIVKNGKRATKNECDMKEQVKK